MQRPGGMRRSAAHQFSPRFDRVRITLWVDYAW